MIKANNYACFETPACSTKKLLFFDNLPILLGPPEKKSREATPHPVGNCLVLDPPPPFPQNFRCPPFLELHNHYFVKLLHINNTLYNNLSAAKERPHCSSPLLLRNKKRMEVNLIIHIQRLQFKKTVRQEWIPNYKRRITRSGSLFDI